MHVRTPTIASVSLALTALLALGVGVTGRAQEAGNGWTQFLPPGSGVGRAIGLSPDWPRDPFLIVTRGGESAGLARTSDGGTTWEALPYLPNVRRFVVAAAPDGGRIIFALVGRDEVHRSTDAGSTWQPVLTVAAGTADLALHLSPSFAHDGLAFALADGQVHRSRDGGLVWERLDPASGQRIEHLAFSPDVARDRTIFLAASNAPLINNQPSGQADPGLSLGVLGSTDGGESWAPLPTQPAIEGVPYRQVGYLAVSPTFGEDGTLVAFAWGPSRPAASSGSPPSPNGALFLSRDRGDSWTSVQTSERPTRIGIAFSPSFAADGTVLLGQTTYPLVARSPGGQTCRVLHSADWGATWTSALFAQDASCFGPHLLAHGGRLIGLVEAGGIRSGITRVGSMDGGRTWNVYLPIPPGDTVNYTDFVVSPGFAEDGAIFVGSATSGLWQYGPLPCPVPMGTGFRRVWESEQWVRDELGCPSTPERTVRVRVGNYTESVSGRDVSTHAYWPEDDGPEWFRIEELDSGRRTWSAMSKEKEPPPAEPDAVLDGAIQRFIRGSERGWAYGWMLWLSYPDGRRTILVLTPNLNHDVHELPD